MRCKSMIHPANPPRTPGLPANHTPLRVIAPRVLWRC
jgi:hypothetical protein